MKLWQKNTASLKEVEHFTVGKDREMDMYLAAFDVLGSLAHIEMLESVGLLNSDELKELQKELKDIYSRIQKGEFKLQDDVEDIHSQVELLLTQKLGDTGKKIHSARSRNDQVLVDIKLFLRNELEELVKAIQPFFELLQSQSEQYKSHLLPGYTHLQLAMPSSFGLWFGAYAESLVDDMITLKAAYDIVNKNPLGSAAGYGSSLMTLTIMLSMPRWEEEKQNGSWHSLFQTSQTHWRNSAWMPVFTLTRTLVSSASRPSLQRAAALCRIKKILMYLN
jgi:argininosuccinate lyase